MLKKNYINKLNLLSKTDIFFMTLDKKNLLVTCTPTSKKKYIEIPFCIDILKEEDFLILNLNSDSNECSFIFNKFFLLLSSWIKNLEKPFKKSLILKGLGFRITLGADSTYLELKLGFSHLIKVLIPTDEVKVSVIKNILIVEGFDPMHVGNFIERIRNLKFPDIYKGKGFWYKNEIISLKEIKKT